MYIFQNEFIHNIHKDYYSKCYPTLRPQTNKSNSLWSFTFIDKLINPNSTVCEEP